MGLRATPGYHVLVGLIMFLTGVALIVASQVAGIQVLIIGGAVCSAVGLGFLTYATSQKQIRRHTGAGSSSGDEIAGARST